MPFSVRDLIAAKPVTAVPEETAEDALKRMKKHNFSQLPVVDEEQRPLGLITHRSILRAMGHWGGPPQSVLIRMAMEDPRPPIYKLDEVDLFEVLDDLHQWNAALIVTAEGKLEGIVTSADATTFLRHRSEDFWLVENIESSVKDIIVSAAKDDLPQWIAEAVGARSEERTRLKGLIGRYVTMTGQQIDQKAMMNAFDQAWSDGKPLDFSRLVLAQYIEILLAERRWDAVKQHVQVDRERLKEHLNWVREIRNDLAHFRRELTDEEKDKLKWAQSLLHRPREGAAARKAQLAAEGSGPSEAVDPAAEIMDPSAGRYERLASHLRSQTAHTIDLTFRELEEIIEARLPASARVHRAWWANDETSHTQSVKWLEAGWRVEDVDFLAERVTFTRRPDREQLYRSFFGDLLAKLRKQASFPLRDTRPSGASWIWVADLRHGGDLAHFGFSFAAGRRFRVELYIDNGDKEDNKAFFDQLQSRRDLIERDVAHPLAWERLDHRKASRIAAYEPATRIDEAARLEALSNDALELMLRFQRAIAQALASFSAR